MNFGCGCGNLYPPEVAAIEPLIPHLRELGFNTYWNVGPGDHQDHIHIDVGTPGPLSGSAIGGPFGGSDDVLVALRLVPLEGPRVADPVRLRRAAAEHRSRVDQDLPARDREARSTRPASASACPTSSCSRRSRPRGSSRSTRTSRPVRATATPSASSSSARRWAGARPQQLLDVEFAATKFFVAAKAADHGQSAGELSDDVQRSCCPWRYPQAEAIAQTFLAQAREDAEGGDKERAEGELAGPPRRSPRWRWPCCAVASAGCGEQVPDIGEPPPVAAPRESAAPGATSESAKLVRRLRRLRPGSAPPGAVVVVDVTGADLTDRPARLQFAKDGTLRGLRWRGWGIGHGGRARHRRAARVQAVVRARRAPRLGRRGPPDAADALRRPALLRRRRGELRQRRAAPLRALVHRRALLRLSRRPGTFGPPARGYRAARIRAACLLPAAQAPDDDGGSDDHPIAAALRARPELRRVPRHDPRRRGDHRRDRRDGARRHDLARHRERHLLDRRRHCGEAASGPGATRPARARPARRSCRRSATRARPAIATASTPVPSAARRPIAVPTAARAPPASGRADSGGTGPEPEGGGPGSQAPDSGVELGPDGGDVPEPFDPPPPDPGAGEYDSEGAGIADRLNKEKWYAVADAAEALGPHGRRAAHAPLPRQQRRSAGGRRRVDPRRRAAAAQRRRQPRRARRGARRCEPTTAAGRSTSRSGRTGTPSTPRARTGSTASAACPRASPAPCTSSRATLRGRR